ncbi:hypothetical protein ACHQM5_022671 [Ranunculus cassubicifolius]
MFSSSMQSRWFVLEKGKLFRFETSGVTATTKPLGSVWIESVASVDNNKMALVVNGNYLYANTADEAKKWIHAIEHSKHAPIERKAAIHGGASTSRKVIL